MEYNAFTDLFSLKEASNIWNVEESVLRRHILNGNFKVNEEARKFGKQWVITRQAMERKYGIIQSNNESDFDYSDNKKSEIYRYIVECSIKYANKYKVDINKTALLFNKYKIYKYIYECYDYLHLGNTDNVVKEIASRIRRRITYEG